MFGFISKYFERKKGIKAYESRLIEAVKDGEISETEKSDLKKIVETHNLTPEDLMAAKKAAFNSFFNLISEDGKITEQENKKLEGIVTFMDVSKSILGFDQVVFNTLHLKGLISENKLVKFNDSALGIQLKEGEDVHYICVAGLMKYKRKTIRANYSGLTASIRITKGLRYRVGSIAVQPVVMEYMGKEDAGIFWISNQRIGFKGSKKHFNIPLEKVSFFEVAEGVLKIAKDGKENPYLIYLTEQDIACGILSLVIEGDYQIAGTTGKVSA